MVTHPTKNVLEYTKNTDKHLSKGDIGSPYTTLAQSHTIENSAKSFLTFLTLCVNDAVAKILTRKKV